MPEHEVRPHFFDGSLSSGRCRRCGREGYLSVGLHSTASITDELTRLHKLEDEVLDITGEPFHRMRMTAANYFVTHPLACRAHGLMNCPVQTRLTDHASQGGQQPLPGDYRVELEGTELVFHQIEPLPR